MSDKLLFLFFIPLSIWIFINLPVLAVGFAEADTKQCEITYYGDYLFPGRKLGCFLGTPTSSTLTEDETNENQTY